MSDEKSVKPDVEDKLMEDNEVNKNYGTDGADIEEAPQPERERVSVKLTKTTRPNLLRTISSYEPKDSNIGFIQKVFTLIFDTILGLIALAITNIIQIASIVIGSVYINDCPLSPGIPAILIVNGSINILVCIFETVKRRINGRSEAVKRLDIIYTCLKVTSTVSFLIWIVLVYDAPTPDYQDKSSERYCNRTVYLFAFWLLTSFLILMAVIMVFACCCCCLAGFVTPTTERMNSMREEPKEQDNTETH